MNDESPWDFGAPPPDELSEDNVIPFPRMRPSTQLRQAWVAAVEARNKKLGSSFRFISAGEATDDLMRVRGMRSMSWPAGWPELARRAPVYPRDVVGVVGSQGGGKTSFGLQACFAAMGSGTPGLWAALELNPSTVLARQIGNLHGVHAAAVRDGWSRERIEHAAASFTDLFHHVDRFRDPDKQLDAMRAAVALAWEIYRVPPLLVVDHIGKLYSNARDPRVGATQALEALRELAEEMDCMVMALSQGSRGNQAILTGKVDTDSASDAIGVAAEARAFEEDCANVIALVVFKADDSMTLDSHVLVTKARHTGWEGKIGFRFSKPGGVWTELQELPATPSEVKAAVESDKKDKHRTQPARSPEQARQDINASKEVDAAASRRARMLAAITRHGMLGIELAELRKVYGVGRGAAFQQSLQELERASCCERIDTRVRVIARSHEG